MLGMGTEMNIRTIRNYLSRNQFVYFYVYLTNSWYMICLYCLNCRFTFDLLTVAISFAIDGSQCIKCQSVTLHSTSDVLDVYLARVIIYSLLWYWIFCNITKSLFKFCCFWVGELGRVYFEWVVGC